MILNASDGAPYHRVHLNPPLGARNKEGWTASRTGRELGRRHSAAHESSVNWKFFGQVEETGP